MGNGDVLAFGCSPEAASLVAGRSHRRRLCRLLLMSSPLLQLGGDETCGELGLWTMEQGLSSSPPAAEGAASVAWRAAHLAQAAALRTGRPASRAGRAGNADGDGRGSECRQEHQRGRATRCGGRSEAVSA